MNRYNIIFILCAVFVTFTSCKSDPKSEATKVNSNAEGVFLDKNVKDVGAIPRDIPVVTKFVVTNNKPDTVNLLEPTTTCDCMKVKLGKRILAPKDTTLVSVTFNARIPGLFSKDIYVNYVGQDSLLFATVKGHVKQ